MLYTAPTKGNTNEAEAIWTHSY